MTHRLLTDAVTDAQLQAAIAVVARMSTAEFFAACDAIGRKRQADPRTLRAYLGGAA